MGSSARGAVLLVSLLLIAASVVQLEGRHHLVFGSGNPHGDINCDGSINPIDAALILQHSASLLQLPDGCGKAEPTDTPTTTPSSTPTDTPVPVPPPDTPTQPPIPTATSTPLPLVGLERSNPIQAGQSLIVPEGWEITIVGSTADATQSVLDENQFNDPPDPGMRFTIVRVRMTNVSAPDPERHDAGFALRLVGSENLSYTTFTDSCGVIPDDIDNGPSEVFRNGTVEGNVCYQVGDTETNFTMFTDFFLSDDANRRWFTVD